MRNEIGFCCGELSGVIDLDTTSTPMVDCVLFTKSSFKSRDKIEAISKTINVNLLK